KPPVRCSCPAAASSSRNVRWGAMAALSNEGLRRAITRYIFIPLSFAHMTARPACRRRVCFRLELAGGARANTRNEPQPPRFPPPDMPQTGRAPKAPVCVSTLQRLPACSKLIQPQVRRRTGRYARGEAAFRGASLPCTVRCLGRSLVGIAERHAGNGRFHRHVGGIHARIDRRADVVITPVEVGQ